MFLNNWNWNLRLNLLLAALSGIADSIWTGTICVAFLYQLTDNSNTKVGLATAITGMAQVLTAFPAGWAADKYPRSRVVAVGGAVMLCAVAVSAYAVLDTVHVSNENSYKLLCAGMFCFGVAGGIISGPAQALLADSLRTGSREKFYNYLFVTYLLGATTGPVLSIVYFCVKQGYRVQSEVWPMVDLRLILLIGIGFDIPVGVVMFLFRDDKALGRASDSISSSSGGSLSDTNSAAVQKTTITTRIVVGSTTTMADDHVGYERLPTHDDTTAAGGANGGGGGGLKATTQTVRYKKEPTDTDLLHESLLPVVDALTGSLQREGGREAEEKRKEEEEEEEETGTDKHSDDNKKEEEEEEENALLEEWRREVGGMTGCGGIITVRSIPYVIFSADLTIALASGMTIKFFPLFFKNDLHLSPAEVQTVYLLSPLIMGVFSTLGTRAAECMGRVQAVMMLRLLGLGCFAMMVMCFRWHMHPYIILGFYLVRTGLMNCTYPLEESILMDYVDKEERARWKSLESVSMFGWCGSAFLGGYLADAHGYAFTFSLTIAIQLTATVMYSSLTTVVSRMSPKQYKVVKAAVAGAETDALRDNC